jgi:hypothetical protein
MERAIRECKKLIKMVMKKKPSYIYHAETINKLYRYNWIRYLTVYKYRSISVAESVYKQTD